MTGNTSFGREKDCLGKFCRIFKNAQIWGIKGKQHEEKEESEDRAGQKNGQIPGNPDAGNGEVICDKERGDHTDKKDCHIYRCDGETQNSAVSVKQNRNQSSPRQDAAKRCRQNVGVFLFQERRGYEDEGQHGKKQQLHMFPGGFVYGEECRGKNIVNSFYYLRTSAGLLEFKKTPCYNNFIQMPEA